MSEQNKNKMWGGRFSEKPADIMQQINASIDVDVRLWRQDIAGSKAHAEMLGKQKILTKDEAKTLIDGLSKIEKEIESGSFEFKRELEDIHMNIEARLREMIGDTAGRTLSLHQCRY